MKNQLSKRKNYGTSPGGDVQLVTDYNMLFDVIVADTPDLLEECFKLRYQVYCVETGFEDKKQFIDQLEKDIFDDRSVSSLLVHKKQELWRGLSGLFYHQMTRYRNFSRLLKFLMNCQD
ncbi:MAG: GNAT family N-acetyltransferase [Emcibacter sp.]|nr:GNAT family N-acetyltransferase [Emcibacter sp.]